MDHNLLRARRFNLFSIILISFVVDVLNRKRLGAYWSSKPLKFSFVLRSQLASVPGKVARTLQRLINQRVFVEVVAVVVCQRLDPGFKARDRLDDRLPYRVSRFL